MNFHFFLKAYKIYNVVEKSLTLKFDEVQLHILIKSKTKHQYKRKKMLTLRKEYHTY